MSTESPDRDKLPLLDSWLSGMATMCAVSLTSIEAYCRLMSLESDECPQPDYSPPEVKTGKVQGHYVLVDESADASDDEAPFIVTDHVENLEACR